MAAPSQNQVPKLYLSVVDDVTSNITEAFLDDGVDESVIEELKNLWLSKLKASKALEPPVIAKSEGVVTPEYLQQFQIQQHQQPTVLSAQPRQILAAGNMNAIHPVHLPIQINNPSRDLTNPAATATMALPAGLFQQQLMSQGITLQQTGTGQLIAVRAMPGSAGTPMQPAGPTSVQVVNPTLSLANAATIRPAQLAQAPQVRHIVQLDGASDSRADDDSCVDRSDPTTASQSHMTKERSNRLKKRRRRIEVIVQLDGAGDTSSEEDDDDEQNDEEQAEDPEAVEGLEEPLNSDDDISEADPTELFDTENVVVCQYDKINRNKNKWKFQLKDGIMNLNGRDYVFQRAVGDAEW